MRHTKLISAVVGVLTVGGLSLVAQTPSVAATGTSASSSASNPPIGSYVPPPIQWGRCKDGGLRADKGQCGFLTVPLDYANPTGTTIQLAVSRVLHTKGSGKGAVFTNPGGPGAGGTYLATLGQYVPHRQGIKYDWYGMDPRGAGSSVPALSCDPGINQFDRQPYTPSTSGILSYWLDRTQAYAASCGSAAASELLAHTKTTDIVNDFEAFRRAIGQTQITWYGFSYGTYLGEVYATLYPSSIKAMVLDGVVDPTRVWYAANLDQDVAFQKTFEKFLAWMGRYDDVYHVGKGKAAVMKTYHRLHRQLTKHPAKGKLGPDELDDILQPAAYYNLTWLDVAHQFSELAHGDPGPAIRAWRASYPKSAGGDNGYAMYLATSCTDAPWPTDWNQWQTDNQGLAQKYPYLTWGNAWFNAPCRTWPAAAGTPVSVSGAAFTGPVLLASQQFDPATPLSGAFQTRSLFPTSRLVEGVGGTSHAVTLDGVGCTDDAVAKLLKNGSLPTRKAGTRADKKCPPLAPPNARNPDARSSARLVALLERLPIPYR